MKFLRTRYKSYTEDIADFKLLDVLRISRILIRNRSERIRYILGVPVGKTDIPPLPVEVPFGEGEWYTALEWGRKVRRLPPPPARNTVPRLPMDSVLRVDIARALGAMPDINRIALVFFMGIGDYYYATPFLEKLKVCVPNLPLVAYVSKNFDVNNSPLVADCLESNPNIAEVKFFDGRPNERNWVNYDYSDALRQEPATTLVLPMVYEHETGTLSRDDALCDTFCLPRSAIGPRPIVYDVETSPGVRRTLDRVVETVRSRGMKGVVWTQSQSRSTKFAFKDSAMLCRMIADSGFAVVSVDPVGNDDERILSLDFSKFKITDSVRLLQLLNENVPVFCLTVGSCFWSISAALDIPNLGIQHFFDERLKAYYYPNNYIVTHKPYHCVPRGVQFVASPGKYTNPMRNRYQYDPVYLLECFQEMLKDLRARGRMPRPKGWGA